jgi:putative oxidoreductase
MRFVDDSLARLLFAIPFAVFGILHFITGQNMAALVPVPGGVFWIYVIGALLIAGGIGVATRLLGSWAALGLALLMLLFVVAIHIPGLGDPATRQMAMGGLLKDTSLMGGALTWFGLLRSAPSLVSPPPPPPPPPRSAPGRASRR